MGYVVRCWGYGRVGKGFEENKLWGGFWGEEPMDE